MKKVLILFVLLFAGFANAQTDYSKVLDLLINNQRSEARKLFDKQFSKSKDQSIDLLILDALIEQEQGQLNYDETLLRKIEKLPNANHYVEAFINSNFILGSTSTEGYDDLTFKKIDFLYNSEVFKKLPIVQYRKGISENKKLNYKEALNYFAEMNTITDWQYVGVFENLNSSGLDTEYEPETYAKNDKVFDANSNGKVNWYNPKYIEKDSYNFLYNEREYGSGIVYAQTFVTVPAEKQYLLKFGTNTGIKIFIDDNEIAAKYETGATNNDAFQYLVTLPSGTHRILVKVESSSSSSYFAVSLVNKDNTKANELLFSTNYKDYLKGSEITFEEKTLSFEQYFVDLVKNNPNNVLYKIYLFEAYKANAKKDLAHSAIEGLDEKYPKSSIISNLFIDYYSMDDEYQKIEEIRANIESNDKDYFFTTLEKLKDGSWLRNAQLKELEDYAEKSKKYKTKYCSYMFDFMLASRNSDLDKMIVIFEDLVKESQNNDTYRIMLANMYERLKNDKTKYLEILEDIVKNKENFSAQSALISFYDDSNQKEKVKELTFQQIDRYPYLNELRTEYINLLIDENNYTEALKYIDENLEQFPYSYQNLEKKADVYRLMKNDKEAEKYLVKALSYDASDSSMRKKLYDLTKTPDEIEEFETKEIYDLIKKRRNTTLKGDYGVTLLLDEYIVNVLPEGGRKSKVRVIYEVTAENGIENLKEYSLNTYGVNLTKSEIVKPNGTLIPAEESGSTLVFPNLAVGDVVYIEYDYVSNSYGRFYKDFNLGFTFNGSYPSIESMFSIIHKSDVKINVASKNGNIGFTEKKLKNDKVLKQWKSSNIPSVPIYEAYAPEYSDITNEINVGTIASWKEISNWYADLVKKNIKFDKVTQNAYNEIFPNGTNGLSETTKAEKIYRYICENITYSFLDFRQSGYVPQKPSKTLTTKLGDCKDLSTLFVTMAEKAGLEANLVLVLTNDNGYQSLPLPSKDFNHCIVKVNLEGKEYFLEMTDKYLPFKSLPMSLYKANALVINFDKAKNENSKLINIPFTNATVNKKYSKCIVNITEDKKEFKYNHKYTGFFKSYYNELFSSATTEEIRNTDLEEDYNKNLYKSISNIKTENLTQDKFTSDIEFNVSFDVTEKLQKLGSLRIVDIPFYEKAYTKDIVAKEKREYPINYAAYENTHEYVSEVELNIPEGTKFIEIPEDKKLQFNNDSFEIKYELVAPNKLLVTRKVNLTWEDVSVADYPKFKEYVTEVLELEEKIVGYK